ncbi:MAG TPA: RHS repeat-associated core domain-containing protein [Dokdonella sp.]|uniref:RHS repeat-associated core domain-containing protein n=1 Tax=Dokdonella sp. TaxID=2291710 RepID=UPI002BF04488|nr:RHS repeat-associated core domain-containing protein [Dokdonella sp.]HUD40521.1 RHS repeat-associated core domain-containing protein [Dokdonella sp.]
MSASFRALSAWVSPSARSSAADPRAPGACSGRVVLLGLLSAVLLSAGVVQAQPKEVSIYGEQGKLLRGSDVVGSLGADLFGDQVSLYTGALEFTQTDVSIPGNSALPVAAGRRYRPTQSNEFNRHFGDWDLDIPHVHGVFAMETGWQTQSGNNLRCSQFSPPPETLMGLPGGGSVPMSPESYWQGSFVYLPGSGDQEILQRASGNTQAPTDGSSYPLVTKSGGMIRCSTIGLDTSNEGFTLLTPDGTRYRFAHLISRQTRPLTGGGGTIPRGGWETAYPPVSVTGVNGQLQRVEIWIVPTVVTDRYGNTVTYTWSGSQLTSIVSTNVTGTPADTRSLNFTYVSGTSLIQSVTAQSGGSPSRTWSYEYSSGRLWRVYQPDGVSYWQFDLGPLSNAPLSLTAPPSNCNSSYPGDPGSFTGTMRHPSGATGSFTLTREEHGRTWVKWECIVPPGSTVTSGSWSKQPLQFGELSLTSKAITGTGLPGYIWTYVYNETISSTSYCWDPAGAGTLASPLCTGSSPTTKTVRVMDPEGSQTRYTFGIRAGVNEGQLLKVESGWNPGTSTAMRTVETTYFPTSGGGFGSSPPWPHPYGTSIQTRGDPYMTERIIAEKKRLTLQQDVGMSWEAQTYDVRGRPLQVIRSRVGSIGSSRTESTTYHDNTNKWVLGQVAQVQAWPSASPSAVTTPVYNTYDSTTANILSHTKYGVLERSYDWYADGTLWKSTDGLGKTTTYSVYKRGIPQTITYHNLDTMQVVVNDTGEIIQVTQAGGTRMYGYDGLGRLASITYPSGDLTTWNTTTLTYTFGTTSEIPGGSHWRQTVTTGNGYTITYLDALLRPAMVKRYDGTSGTTEAASRQMVLKRFDGQGRTTFESYPQRTIASIGSSPPGTTTSYDALGRVSQTVAKTELSGAAADATTTIQYLTGFQKRVTNPRGAVTDTWYQLFDEPSEDAPIQISENVTTLIESEKRSTTIARDVYGRPTTVTRSGTWDDSAISATRRYVYDPNHRLCKIIEPETGGPSSPNGATVIDYDAAGNVAWEAKGQALTDEYECQRGSVPVNAKATMSYDDRNRLELTTFGDNSPKIRRTWTADNLLLTVRTEPWNTTSLLSQWTYTYDKRRLLRSEALAVSEGTFTTSYGYDANGSRTSMTYPDNTTVNYSPNQLGQPSRLSSGGINYASDIAHAANGGVSSFTYGNSISHTVIQNLRGLPASVQNGSFLIDAYTYDVNGNVKTIDDLTPTSSNKRQMSYDGLDRLNGVEIGVSPTTANVVYAYDALDNFRRNYSWTPGYAMRDFQYTYTKNRLTQIYDSENSSTLSYNYNARGEMTYRYSPGAPLFVAHDYVYDIGGRMSQVKQTGTSTVLAQYDYDGNGRRIRISEDSEPSRLQVYTQAGQLVYERSGTAVTKHVYLNRHLLAKIDASGVTYQHTDALGTPVFQTNSAGTTLDANRRPLEPYGEPSNKVFFDGPDFTGHMSDELTKLVYMQARYYDPVQSRFVSTDPVSSTLGSFNRYWYANNSPYNNIDPDGRKACGTDTTCSLERGDWGGSSARTYSAHNTFSTGFGKQNAPTKEIQGWMNSQDSSDRQKAADEAVSRFKIESKSKYSGPHYDPGLRDNGITEYDGGITVRVGPTAYKSWSYLGYILSHEIEVHVGQFALMSALRLDFGNKRAYNLREVEAYRYNLRPANLARFGNTEEEISEMKSRLEYYKARAGLE